MNIKRLLNRIIWLPIGFIKGIWEVSSEKARDFDNKRVFPHAIIDDGCYFSSDTTIGKNSHIHRGSMVNHSVIGAYTYLNFNVLIQNSVIGNYCSISTDVNIGLGLHPLNLFSTSPVFYKVNNTLKVKLVKKDWKFDEYKSIKIGSDVWIGAKVIVMDGLNIGHGAVLAAGAVVTKDVPPYAIVGGVPAKIIKYRFPGDVIAKLLMTAWWEKSAEEVFSIREELLVLCKTNFFNDKNFL